MIFRLAEKSDDTQLRHLMQETVMPGHIRMIYSREPNFFDCYEKSDEKPQVIVADENEKIVGLGCRSIRELFINGVPQPVGYLSGLRLSPFVRDGLTLARGYSFLKKLHADDTINTYFTTIISGNEKAEKILTSKRAGLPAYIKMGEFLTSVIPVKGKYRTDPEKENGILKGTEIEKEELLEFLNSEGSCRQFFPVCKSTGKDIINSIGMENIYVSLLDNKINGVMGLWNQEKFKQNKVVGYSTSFKILKPVFNIILRLKGCSPLPAEGGNLKFGIASLVCVKNDDLYVFKKLLYHILKRAGNRGLQYLAIGLHEKNSLRKEVNKYFKFDYKSALYLVSWDDETPLVKLDESKIPYLELGTL